MSQKSSDHLTALREALLSDEPLTFSPAMVELLVQAPGERLISFGQASHVDALAAGERHREALVDLALCLVYRHDWPRAPEGS